MHDPARSVRYCTMVRNASVVIPYRVRKSTYVNEVDALFYAQKAAQNNTVRDRTWYLYGTVCTVLKKSIRESTVQLKYRKVLYSTKTAVNHFM